MNAPRCKKFALSLYDAFLFMPLFFSFYAIFVSRSGSTHTFIHSFIPNSSLDRFTIVVHSLFPLPTNDDTTFLLNISRNVISPFLFNTSTLPALVEIKQWPGVPADVDEYQCCAFIVEKCDGPFYSCV